MASTFVFEAFLKSLIETVIWSTYQIEIAQDQPMVWPLTGTDGVPWRLSDNERKQFCDSIVAERAQRVMALNPSRSQDVLDLIRQGRLMVLLYYWTLSDGTPRIESRGYFDDENYPPWDTWVAHIDAHDMERRRWQTYLIAWVPPKFVRDVNDAIETCADGSILWLTDWGETFKYTSLFRQARLWI